MIPARLVRDRLCTYMVRESYWKAERQIPASFCERDPVMTFHNVMTGERYYLCRQHMSDEALWTASRMGLTAERMQDDESTEAGGVPGVGTDGVPTSAGYVVDL